MIYKFSNEKGFGLVTVLVVILLASIALASMFVATIYAKYKVQEDYHYRKALLVLQSRMEHIKFTNDRYGAQVYPSFVTNPTTVHLDQFSDGSPLVGYIQPSKRRFADIQVGHHIWYDVVTLTLTWEEPYIWGNTEMTKQKSVMLREDYYYEWSPAGGGI
ncbi:MAG: hypothetical protein U9N34_11535 [Candidatus Cloacimonadota bacterium]|nr:hypothetical protein [Candidatus Cloacimonadota bacterium]